jgi:hypothetical protein
MRCLSCAAQNVMKSGATIGFGLNLRSLGCKLAKPVRAYLARKTVVTYQANVNSARIIGEGCVGAVQHANFDTLTAFVPSWHHHLFGSDPQVYNKRVRLRTPYDHTRKTVLLRCLDGFALYRKYDDMRQGVGTRRCKFCQLFSMCY